MCHPILQIDQIYPYIYKENVEDPYKLQTNSLLIQNFKIKKRCYISKPQYMNEENIYSDHPILDCTFEGINFRTHNLLRYGDLFKLFINQVRSKHPEIPIMQISITPTKSRWKYWKKINKTNDLIKTYCLKKENLFFIDTVKRFLNDEGKPKTEWFVNDQLHLNKLGYAEWSNIIKDAISREIPLL